jgi:hypothetical protein
VAKEYHLNPSNVMQAFQEQEPQLNTVVMAVMTRNRDCDGHKVMFHRTMDEAMERYSTATYRDNDQDSGYEVYLYPVTIKFADNLPHHWTVKCSRQELKHHLRRLYLNLGLGSSEDEDIPFNTLELIQRARHKFHNGFEYLSFQELYIRISLILFACKKTSRISESHFQNWEIARLPPGGYLVRVVEPSIHFSLGSAPIPSPTTSTTTSPSVQHPYSPGSSLGSSSSSNSSCASPPSSPFPKLAPIHHVEWENDDDDDDDEDDEMFIHHDSKSKWHGMCN